MLSITQLCTIVLPPTSQPFSSSFLTLAEKPKTEAEK